LLLIVRLPSSAATGFLFVVAPLPLGSTGLVIGRLLPSAKTGLVVVSLAAGLSLGTR
jgi:hypothetical protein